MKTTQTFLSLLALLSLMILCLGTARANQAAPATLPTLWIIGDSTVKNGTHGLQGWGDPISASFDPTKIHVENCARGGRSSRTFQTEGLWNAVLTRIKPGDFVLMQFGHNDGGSPTTSYRASLKGIGDETRTITNPKTNQPETVHTYGWYMNKYVAEAKAKGATPIVLSPIPRDIWTGAKVNRSRDNDYGGWAAQVAQAEKVPFIDLNAITSDKYDAMGFDKVKSAYFPGDHTHTNPAGAQVNAASVVDGIKALPNCLLADDLLPMSKPIVSKN
jgi:rhamnogalacturonan acetylesterase